MRPDGSAWRIEATTATPWPERRTGHTDDRFFERFGMTPSPRRLGHPTVLLNGSQTVQNVSSNAALFRVTRKARPQWPRSSSTPT